MADDQGIGTGALPPPPPTTPAPPPPPPWRMRVPRPGGAPPDARTASGELVSTLPPPPAPWRPAIVWPSWVRPAATVVALGAMVWSAVVLVASVAAPRVVAGVGNGLLAPALMAMVVPWLVILGEHGGRLRARSMGLRGWRASVSIGLLAAAVAVFVGSVVFGWANAPADEVDGHYFDHTHGQQVEISRDEYLDRRIGSIRLLAVVPLVVGGLALLVLSAPQTVDGPEARPAWWPHQSGSNPPGAWTRARGFQLIEQEVPGDLASTLDRIRRTVPVISEIGSSSAATAAVQATWRVRVGRGGVQVRMEGSLAETLHGTTRIDLELGLTSRILSWVLPIALPGLVFFAIGIGMIVSVAVVGTAVGGDLSSGGGILILAFGVLWTAIAVGTTAYNLTAPWRAGLRAADQVTQALLGV